MVMGIQLLYIQYLATLTYRSGSRYMLGHPASLLLNTVINVKQKYSESV